jgi:hypothetical protein
VIGESVAALVEERIAETITADAGRHRLALLHGIKSAAGHMAGDVPSAKLAGAGLWRGHRSKRARRNEYRGGGGYCLQTLSHHLVCVLSRCWFFSRCCLASGRRWDASDRSATLINQS